MTAAVQLPREGSQVRTKNLRDFEGPLPDLLADSLDWVRENSPRITRYTTGGHMVEECLYPLDAVRELIANALIHRDLSPNSEGKWVEIRLTDDSLVITNPGGLRGISTEQLESSTLSKNAVNPRLYEMAKRVQTRDGKNVIEGEGAGIQEVFRTTREASLIKPKLIDTGVQFTAIVYGAPAFNEEEERWLKEISITSATPLSAVEKHDATKNAGRNSASDSNDASDSASHPGTITKNGPIVLAALTASGPAKIETLIRDTGLTDGQIRYALDKLMAAGLVTREGGWGDRHTVYRT